MTPEEYFDTTLFHYLREHSNWAMYTEYNHDWKVRVAPHIWTRKCRIPLYFPFVHNGKIVILGKWGDI